ncbi:MAG: hypothetical protein HY062_12525 [Bacteroidetes bacterium]|nr:hypothetical protein [Bacteroidota bacterium]
MNYSLLICLFWCCLLPAQIDTNNHIGQLMAPPSLQPDEPLNYTITLPAEDRSRPAFIKGTYHNKDTIYQLIYDTTYKGTAKELLQDIIVGNVVRYTTLEKDGKMHERIKIIKTEESFLEQNWMNIGAIILVIIGFIIYGNNLKKVYADEEDIENND